MREIATDKSRILLSGARREPSRITLLAVSLLLLVTGGAACWAILR